MSGSQHNPNGRQPQLGSGWSPLQLQMANLLARAPQAHAHLAAERGVTWHTPTPPPHLYHVPVPSPPDPLQGLQAMKGAGGNSVFRHTATPPELYRHTPTPPDKHLMRHTPSPGDVKGPPVDIYPHLGPGSRDKLMRAEELLSYARQGSLDLSLGSRANGAAPHHPASPALSVRDAPTINSLIARAAPRRVDSLLERLVPSPHSVIVHSRVASTPSPPSSNEDSGDSCGAPPGSKRKRKPERTIRLPPVVPLPPPDPAPAPEPDPTPASPTENGDTEHIEHTEQTLHTGGRTEHMECSERTNTDITEHMTLNGPAKPGTPPVAPSSPKPVTPPRIADESARRKTRSGSAETIADIAAMIAGGSVNPPVAPPLPPPLSVDKLQRVLASPEAAPSPARDDPPPQGTPTAVATAAAPRRRSARANSESSNVPVASPSEAKAAEPDPAPTEPAAASFVEVENQLEKMFAGLEEPNSNTPSETTKDPAPASKRRKSAPGRGRADTLSRRKGPRKKPEAKPSRKPKEAAKDTKEYDSGSNASSGKSRGPYIQIRGGASSGSPVSVCVMNAGSGEEEPRAPRGAGVRGPRGAGARGLHASTLGLRYDAATRDLTWLCAFCARGPHAAGLGDLFGPYPVDMDCAEYRSLDEATRRLSPCRDGEAWVHAACSVWAPGVVAAGARVWGLSRAAWGACVSRCRHCARAGAALACAARSCGARAHLPCATEHAWSLDERAFRALCPVHKENAPH